MVAILEKVRENLGVGVGLGWVSWVVVCWWYGESSHRLFKADNPWLNLLQRTFEIGFPAKGEYNVGPSC